MRTSRSRGISPILATIVLIAIVVAGGVLVYNVFFGAASTAAKATEIQITSATLVQTYNGADVLTLQVKNSGNAPLDESTLSLLVGGASVPTRSSGTLQPGQSMAVTVSIRLLGHWPLTDGSGTTAVDTSGNGNTGTLVNSPTWATGKFGSALQFNGGSYVSIVYPSNECGSTGAPCVGGSAGPSGLAYLPTTGTYSMWFETSSTSVGLMYVSGTNFGGGCDRQLWIDSNGYLNFGVWSEVDFGGSIPVNDGNWHMLMATMGGASGGFNTYLDGKPYASSSSTTGNGATGGYSSGFNWADTLLVGAGGCRGGSGNFNGAISDVRVYNAALSPAQAMDIYNNEVGGQLVTGIYSATGQTVLISVSMSGPTSAATAQTSVLVSQ